MVFVGDLHQVGRSGRECGSGRAVTLRRQYARNRPAEHGGHDEQQEQDEDRDAARLGHEA